MIIASREGGCPVDDDLFAEIGDRYFLDFAVGFYDITTLGKVGIPERKLTTRS